MLKDFSLRCRQSFKPVPRQVQSESQLKRKARRKVHAADCEVLDTTETDRYRSQNPQLPAVDVVDLSATYGEFQHEEFEEGYVDQSLEELMEFFGAARAHEEMDHIGSVSDRLLVEGLYRLESRCWHGSYTSFVVEEEEIEALGPAVNGLYAGFVLNRALDDILWCNVQCIRLCSCLYGVFELQAALHQLWAQSTSSTQPRHMYFSHNFYHWPEFL